MKKVVVVTGASSGIGKEVALQYIQKGYAVIVTARNQDKLKEFVGNEQVDVVVGDLTKESTQNEILRIVEEKHKRLDVLVNNAGIIYLQPFTTNTKEQVDQIMEINLKTPMLLTQKLYPVMVSQQFGHIVFVNSTAGKEAKPNHTMYNASKFGLTGFAISLRHEAKQNNIRVTSFHPGGTKSNLYDDLQSPPDMATYMNPSKVAEVLVYLTETEGLSPDEIVLNRMTK